VCVMRGRGGGGRECQCRPLSNFDIS